MSQSNKYDVVIIGGGLAGVSLACYLAQQSGDQLQIALIERFAYPSQEEEALYQPSFDARSTALSYGSRLIYEQMQIWPLLSQHVSPINDILVSDKGHWSQTRMQASEHELPAFGYVVENAWLGRVLLKRLQDFKSVQLLAPAEVKALQPQYDGTELMLMDESLIKADLTVIADGVNSTLAAQLGIKTRVEDYQQQAVICNVSFKEPHKGCAYERFMKTGPMALLPLTNDTTSEEHRAALVWCLPAERAEALQHCSESEFLQALQQAFGYRQGAFTKVGKRGVHPLCLTQSQEQVRNHIVVLGNAAHTLHPVAGQGYNLVLRDIACLVDVVLASWQPGKRVKSSLLELDEYLTHQLKDQQRTILFSDWLPKIFQKTLMPVQLSRGLGLLALELSPHLQQNFVRFAAGLAGSLHTAHKHGVKP